MSRDEGGGPRCSARPAGLTRRKLRGFGPDQHPQLDCSVPFAGEESVEDICGFVPNTLPVLFFGFFRGSPFFFFIF